MNSTNRKPFNLDVAESSCLIAAARLASCDRGSKPAFKRFKRSAKQATTSEAS
jgi:hypothetical protein